jgi:hypothetical protein
LILISRFGLAMTVQDEMQNDVFVLRFVLNDVRSTTLFFLPDFNGSL